MTKGNGRTRSGLGLLRTSELPRLSIDPRQRRLAISSALIRSDHDDSAALLHGFSVFAELRRSDRGDAVAIRDAEKTWTYSQLATAALRTASLLAGAGAGPGDVVAVGGPRRAEVVAAFLACDLIGAVYLPVEHTWPIQRILGVLAGSGAAALLWTAGDPAGSDGPLGGADIPVISGADIPASPPWQGTPAAPGATGISYVLYTSGSTGAPKGAVIERRGLLNHLAAKVADLALAPADRVAQTAPLGFDISIWQFLAPLLAGGQVHIIGDELAQDPPRLLPYLSRHGITVAELVPTLLRSLLEAMEQEGTDGLALRWMIATGEELPPATAARFARLAPAVSLMNAYGPTECSDDVTHFVVSQPDPQARHLPIGWPVAGTQLYVLRQDDGHWMACPRGEAGELFVGGTGVGRGYLDDPGRTRQAFFQDPFARTATGRLYRTGDAVVALASGVLEYRGRVDRQVKIAGFRMEPAEIEAVLARHPRVAACAVVVAAAGERDSLVARETKVERPGAAELCAFACPADGGLTGAELRDYLAGRLPLPMVPRRYELVAELPLTGNGKVDYRRLAALAASQESGQIGAHDPPVGPAETAVAVAMADVLGVPGLGRHDSFLALGGDSLAAIRLVGRLREEGYELSMREVLLGGTPRAVARSVSAVTGGPPPSAGPPPASGAEQAGRRIRPLTPQQSGVYFHWRLAPENPYYNYQGTVRLTGAADTGRLARAWDALLAENPQLTARFLDSSEDPGHEYPYWEIPLPAETDLSGLGSREREERYRSEAYADAAQPFSLIGEPVVRVRSFRMGPADLRLLITTHEIMLDGWGTTVLCRRLAELYADPGARLDPGRYDRYLDWQGGRLASAELAAAGAYWRGQLAGELPVLQPPSDLLRPPRPSYRGGIVEELVPDGVAGRIRELGRDGITPFMAFLAAYSLALGYFSGADEVVVGAPIANRDRAEQLDVPAFLLNMLPFRVHADLSVTGREYLESVRETVLAGYAAAEYPFGWMLRDLPGAARSAADTPVFQTMLNMITYPSRRIEAGGAEFEFTEMESGFVKYDCSLFVQAHGRNAMLAQLDYHLDVMTRDTAGRLLESTLLGLRALAAEPGLPLGEIDLLPAADRAVIAEFAVGAAR